MKTETLPGAEMKARAADLVDTLLTSKLRGKWRARDFTSKVAAFAAKEVAEATTREREECAAIAEKLANAPHWQIGNPKQRMTIQETAAAIAKAIHSRSQMKGEGL